MKISEIVEKTEEYRELGVLIEEFEGALKSISKSRLSPEREEIGLIPWRLVSTTLVLSSSVSIYLHEEASGLIRDDLEVLLRRHLKELEKRQDNLQIGGK